MDEFEAMLRTLDRSLERGRQADIEAGRVPRDWPARHLGDHLDPLAAAVYRMEAAEAELLAASRALADVRP